MSKMPIDSTASVNEEEGEIVLSTRAIIGRVKYSRYGSGSPVEAAFAIAGKYLNEQAQDGNEAEVEFEFMGAHFIAGTNTPQNVQDERMAPERP